MRKGSNRGSIEDGPGWGQAGGPRVHRPKTRGRNRHGEGAEQRFGWAGKEGTGVEPREGEKRVWVREGELTGDLPGWHKGRWISRLFPESSLLPDFKRTLMTEDEWLRKKEQTPCVCVSVCWRWRYGNLKSMKTQIRFGFLCTWS